jgi:hypothetical protein
MHASFIGLAMRVPVLLFLVAASSPSYADLENCLRRISVVHKELAPIRQSILDHTFKCHRAQYASLQNSTHVIVRISHPLDGWNRPDDEYYFEFDLDKDNELVAGSLKKKIDQGGYGPLVGVVTSAVAAYYSVPVDPDAAAEVWGKVSAAVSGSDWKIVADLIAGAAAAKVASERQADAEVAKQKKASAERAAAKMERQKAALAAGKTLQQFEQEEAARQSQKAALNKRRADALAAGKTIEQFKQEEAERRQRIAARNERRAAALAAGKTIEQFEREEVERRLRIVARNERRAAALAAGKTIEQFKQEEEERRKRIQAGAAASAAAASAVAAASESEAELDPEDEIEE